MYTIRESEVFNVILDMSLNGSVADIKDVVETTGLDAKVARGVIGSLSKKGKVHVEEVETMNFIGRRVKNVTNILYWPIHEEFGACFWCDLGLDDSEIEAARIA